MTWWRRLMRREPARPLAEELEPRVLYSADLNALWHADAAAPGAEVRMVEDEPVSAALPGTNDERRRQEIVFVDAGVADADTLLKPLQDRADAGTLEIVRLRAGDDALAQISATLAGRSGVDAVHLIAHGASAQLRLGSTLLDADALQAHAAEIAGWGKALSAQADLLVYGCDVAQGAEGQAFVQQLARLTGADVAASVDLTGAADLGGNWTLEFATGAIHTQLTPSTFDQLQWQGVLATFTVNSTADTNTGAGSSGTLRWVIGQTNANGAGLDIINFNLGGGGLQTINVLTALPTISGAVTIDGWSQPGYTTSPLIQLNGGNLGTLVKGLTFGGGSDGSTVRGLIINRFTGSGIEISGASNLTVQGNWIGLDSTGTAASANAVNGIYAWSGSGHQIGGTTAAQRNVISGNTRQGIYFDAVNSSTISGNYIGTNATGTGDVNGTGQSTPMSGIYVINGSSGNIIGGTSASARNVISGNNHYGFEFLGATTQNNQLIGNYIGTDHTGLVALGNTSGGASYWGAGAGNVVGGGAAGAGNVISGNGSRGVQVSGGTTGAKVQGNYIGVGADGVTLVGNVTYGVLVDGGSTGTLIGTDANGSNDAAERNVISGNTFGVYVTDSGTTGTAIAGNYIGLAADGSTIRANSSHGVAVVSSAGATMVGGATSVSRNVISGNAGFGVYFASSTSGSSVLSNYIGTSATGTVARANLDGVWIDSSAGNTIGQAGAGNLISGNTYWGITVDGAGAVGNTIRANLIGTDAAGGAPLPNGADGIRVTGAATATAIGGTAVADRNLISGNVGAGIKISDSGTSGTVVRGNYVGTNAAGTAAIANAGNGVSLWFGASGNTIGGTAAGAGNLLSGNTGTGLTVADTGTSNNTVQGNVIGLNAAGSATLGNGAQGIWVGSGTQSNTFGGTAAGAGNVIGGSFYAAIEINGATTTGNVVQGNTIGTNLAGTLNAGNSAGVLVLAGAGSNPIGGTAAGAGNVVANSTGVGIGIAGTGTGNAVLGNRVYASGGLGIDLRNDGVTSNESAAALDADTGANNLQNFPILSNATTDGVQVTIPGTLDSAANGYYRVEFFASASGDASGHGEASRYLGSVNVATDGAGHGTFNAVLTAPVAIGEVVTATATASNAGYTVFTDTSEFASNVVANAEANDAPVNTVPGAQVMNEDSSLVFSSAGGNLISIADIDAPAAIVQVTLTATNGTITLPLTMGPEFRVNTTTAGKQEAPEVAVAADGSYIAVWQSENKDGDKTAIVMQRYDASGLAQGGEVVVNTTPTDEQTNPSIALSDNGSFVVVWESKAQDNGGSLGIYGQRFDAAGAKVGAEFLVNTVTADDQSAPRVAIDAAGNFVVVWQSKSQDPDGSIGIYAQRFDAAAVKQGIEFRVNTTTADDQEAPSVAMNGAGSFVVAWQSKNQDGQGRGVYARLYNAAGVAQTGEVPVNQFTAGDQRVPVVAMDDSGKFVVAWTSKDQDGSREGIYARRFDAAGTALAAEFRVNTTLINDQEAPSIAMNGAGAFAIGWQSDEQDGNKEGVYFKSYDASGVMLRDEQRLNSVTANEQRAPSIGIDGMGGVLAVWTSRNQDGSSEGVYGQRMLPPGAISYLVGDGTQDATVTVRGTLANLNYLLDGLVFEPTANFNGTATLQIVTDDLGNTGPGGAQTDTDVVNITVLPLNDPPSFNLPPAQNTVEGTPLVYSGAGGNAISLIDDALPGDSLQLSLAAGNGVLTLAGTTGLTFSLGNGTANAAMTFTGTLANINAALNGMSFLANGSFTGPAYVSLNASDLGSTGAGPVGLASATLSITVTPDGANAAPVVTVPGAQTNVVNSTVVFSGGTAIVLTDDSGSNPVQVTLTATDGTVTLKNGTIGSETRVNTTTAAEQRNSQIAMAADGSHVVVWTSRNQDGNGEGVFAQRYDAFGQRLGQEFQVNTEFSSDQDLVGVAMNTAGDFIVVWESNNQDGELGGIFAQRYNASGTRVGNEFQVNTRVVDDQTAPVVALADSGSFVIVWQSKAQDNADGKIGIYAQRFDASGVEVGDETLVNTTTLSDQLAPAIAMDAAGNYVIVWQSDGQDGSDKGIFAQRFNAAGVAQGGEFLVNTTTANDQTAPAVAMDDAGNFVVAWTSKAQDNVDGKLGIYARRFAANGTALTGELAGQHDNAERPVRPHDRDGRGRQLRHRLAEHRPGRLRRGHLRPPVQFRRQRPTAASSALPRSPQTTRPRRRSP